VWWTGTISESEMRKEHPLELERLTRPQPAEAEASSSPGSQLQHQHAATSNQLANSAEPARSNQQPAFSGREQ